VSPQRSATEEMQTLGALLRAPFEAMLDHHFTKLAQAGFADVRIAHGAVLRYIAREGSRITELADRARMTKQSMAELVEYLRARGYVELVPDPSDGRAKLVRLTARGWKVHATLVAISGIFEKQCAQGLGEEKWRQLRALLAEFAAWARASAPAQPDSTAASRPATGAGRARK
jgi:DNA-binding MarR family transcriptional regulator